MQHDSVTLGDLDLGWTRMFSDYFIYFYLSVLSPLTAILLLINRSVNKFYNFITFSLQVNPVILLLYCLVLMLRL